MRRISKFVTVLTAVAAAAVAAAPAAHAGRAPLPDVLGDMGPLSTASTVPSIDVGSADALGPVVRPVVDAVAASAVGTVRDKLETAAYWTTARMRAARPVPRDSQRRSDLLPSMPSVPLGGLPGTASPQQPQQRSPQQAPRSGNESGGAFSWRGSGSVTRTTGKVFFTLAGSDYVCSGSAVRSANRSTVLTAGHCVNSGPGEFASHWIFVPAYRDGERPFGTWTARRLFAPTAWTEHGDIDQDVGFAVLDTRDGDHLTSVVGSQPIAFNAPRGQYSYAFGYPALGRYNGDSLYFCRDKVRADRYGSTDQGMRCDMTDGSSGGPWLSRFDPRTGAGVLTSVNSFGYDGMPDVMWGPYFGDTIKSVFDTAQRG